MQRNPRSGDSVRQEHNNSWNGLEELQVSFIISFMTDGLTKRGKSRCRFGCEWNQSIVAHLRNRTEALPSVGYFCTFVHLVTSFLLYQMTENVFFPLLCSLRGSIFPFKNAFRNATLSMCQVLHIHLFVSTIILTPKYIVLLFSFVLTLNFLSFLPLFLPPFNKI